MRADGRIKRVDMCAEPEAGQGREQGGHRERTRMDREAGQGRGQGPGMTVCLGEKQPKRIREEGDKGFAGRV